MTLDEFLAVEVMGYEYREDEISSGNWHGTSKRFYRPDKTYMTTERWSPTTNLELAMMCLNQSKWWDISYDELENPSYFVAVQCNSHRWEETNEALPMTISLACARARGWNE